MILTEDQNNSQYRIQSYENGCITVNSVGYHLSVIISANTLITDWPPQTVNELTLSHFKTVFALQPQLVLLGTGQQFVVPAARLLAEFYQRHIGLEYMNTKAACQTFIALSAEGRNVVAALLN